MRRLMAVLVALWLLPLSASAHAEIVSSTPRAGSTLDTAPQQITASFSQKLASDESSLTVLDAQGARVDNDDSAVDAADSEGKTMRVTLKDNLAAGTYTVEWNTLSAEDGEATDGQFQFTLSAAAAQPSPSASASASASASPSASARPSASPSAAASASASAAASPAASPAGLQAGALPDTGTADRPLGVAAVAAVLLALGLLLRRGPRV